MPPRSVCLNVFTTSLGDASAAQRGDAGANPGPGVLERRDSAFSEDSRRASASQPAQASLPPISALHRADLLHSLRPMASTETLNLSLTSKPCTACAAGPARRRCSRCKAAYYCDRTCQKSHWKTHRHACEPLSQPYSAPPTPNPSSPASPVTEA